MRRTPQSWLWLVWLGTAACTGTIDRSEATFDVDDDGDGDGGRGGGGNTPAPAVCNSKTVSIGQGHWRRLTRTQYVNSVKDLLGVDANVSSFLADSTTGSFATNTLPPQDNDIAAYFSSAEAIADKAVANLERLTGCESSVSTDACGAKFIKDLGTRMYRHELTTTETAALTETFNSAKADGLAAGIKSVVQAMLQSPSFLYLTEFGTEAAGDAKRLSSYEVATRLSYLLWNTTPDAGLMTAAKNKELDDEDGISKQAERLMKDPRFATALADFHAQLLHLKKLTDGDLVQKKNPADLNEELRRAMVDEVSSFAAYAVANRQANVKWFLSAPYSFPKGPLLGLYGLTAGQLSDGRYEWKDGQRAGLLTSPALMAAEPPVPTPFAIVHRGKVVRTLLLCDEPPPPPADLNFEPSGDADTTPPRALLEKHMEDPSCAGCHKLMDPIGLGFERYDPIGRFRTTYPKGQSIDPSGEVMIGTDIEGRFDNAADLAAKLGQSKQVRECLGTHWFRYAYGRQPQDEDACAVETFANELSQGDGDLTTSLLSFVTSDAFRFRKGVQQ